MKLNSNLKLNPNKIKYKKNYNYEEFLINDIKIRKLYEIYIKKTIIDKFLDLLILISIFLIIIGFFIEFLFSNNYKLNLFIDLFSIIILFIFVLDLFREYLKSKNLKYFFKNNWIDFILIISLSVYFLFITSLGFFKFLKLDLLKNLVSKIKHIKILFNYLKNKFPNFKLKNK